MTYCVAIRLQTGMVFASDTRTNAGIDHISTFRKLYQFGVKGERFLVLQTAGNLATSQAVFVQLQQDINQGVIPNLHTVSTVFNAAQLIGECVRRVISRAQVLAQQPTSFTSSFMLGGQIKGQPPELYMIYPEGNCIRATQDTPYFQLGEMKYGKPILDRSMSYQSTLQEAIHAILISFDSTIRSNLSVGMPIDLVVYHNDMLISPVGRRIDRDDEYFSQIRRLWSDGLKGLLQQFPDMPEDYTR